MEHLAAMVPNISLRGWQRPKILKKSEYWTSSGGQKRRSKSSKSELRQYKFEYESSITDAKTAFVSSMYTHCVQSQCTSTVLFSFRAVLVFISYEFN